MIHPITEEVLKTIKGKLDYQKINLKRFKYLKNESIPIGYIKVGKIPIYIKDYKLSSLSSNYPIAISTDSTGNHECRSPQFKLNSKNVHFNYKTIYDDPHCVTDYLNVYEITDSSYRVKTDTGKSYWIDKDSHSVELFHPLEIYNDGLYYISGGSTFYTEDLSKKQTLYSDFLSGFGASFVDYKIEDDSLYLKVKYDKGSCRERDEVPDESYMNKEYEWINLDQTSLTQMKNGCC